MSDQKPKSFAHKDYYVGWVCALPKEHVAATAMLDERHTILPKPPNSHDDNTYTLGSMGNHNVVIACLPKGKTGTVSAAGVAVHMVTTFPNLKFCLMVGIGSGVPANRVRLGDVVISTPIDKFPGVVQWDMGKATQGGNFERTGALNSPPNILLTALTSFETEQELGESKMSEYLEQLKNKFPKVASRYAMPTSPDLLFRSDYHHMNKGPALPNDDEEGYEEEHEKTLVCKYCDKTKLVNRNPREMHIHYGLIASGNQIINDASLRDKLNKSMNWKVLCLEKEAAGLLNSFPCMIIRGISDYADSHSNTTWESYAAVMASAIAKEFLSHVQASEVEEEIPMKDIVDKVNTIERKLDRVDSKLSKNADHQVLDWLGGDYGAQQSDYLQQRQPGSGQWLLNSSEFQKWLRGHGETLFCSGIPGAGKTIATSIVVDTVHQLIQESENIGLAYIYCNYKRQREQEMEVLLGSVLRQLTQWLPKIPKDVEMLYQKHKRSGTRPLLAEVAGCLVSVGKLYSKVMIIIDALDECPEGRRARFHKEMRHFQENTQANYFVTSRKIPEIASWFTDAAKLEIRATNTDLWSYLESHFQNVPGIVGDDLDLQKEVGNLIVETVDGMFLLAKLRLESLAGMACAKEVLDTLKKDGLSPPTDVEAAYDAAYNDAMDRIQTQVPSSRKRAFKALSWITFACQPLTIQELQDALAVQIHTTSFDKRNIPRADLIIGACGGLVTVTEKTSIVRLVHYTTQEYFERTKETWFPNAQFDILNTCMTYLRYDTVKELSIFRENGGKEVTFDETDTMRVKHMHAFADREDLKPNKKYDQYMTFEIESQIRDRLETLVFRKHILYGYIALNWFHHIRKIPADRRKGTISGFLTDRDALSTYSRAMSVALDANAFESPQWIDMESNSNVRIYSERVDSMQAVHIAACVGLDDLLVDLLNETNLNIRDSNGATPISWAARRGHESTVKMLLERGALIELADGGNRTPLWWAVSMRHEVITKLLVERGANSLVEDLFGDTILATAVRMGLQNIVEILIEGGADPDHICKLARVKDITPLHRAIIQDYPKMAKYLVEHGANISCVALGSDSPLFTAIDSERCDYDLVKFLIGKGANANHFGRGGDTALTRTCRKFSGPRCDILLRLLLEHGADPNQDPPEELLKRNGQDVLEHNPLRLATIKENSTAVEILLGAGANLEAKNNKGETALMIAANMGRGANLEATNNEGETALLIAVAGKDRYIMESLIGKGASMSVKDKFGQTLLTAAITNGDTNLAYLLIQRGADLEARNDEGDTALLVATNEMKHGRSANIDATDKYGRTSLVVAITNRSHDLTLFLVEAGADIYANNMQGGTAFDIAEHYMKEELRRAYERRRSVMANANDTSTLHVVPRRGM
ncbi:hypothetical protein H072_6511 [Dactylellina haptotyla CBS 200.50]|uniref:Uncharacterized protein n=1 Tax=Dactylellina haptotyla (strain CBS 200.50) TaxID=1284197 RepID=S8A9W1_DACHA|nr:hypothetical protein H072_6511 [Dactylellina haptotyla CBS 200.50]